MKSKQQLTYFCILFLFAYIAFSVGTTQFIPFLTEVGFNAMERGLLLSAIAIATIFFQFIIGFVSDKLKTIKKIVLIALVFYVGFSYLFYNSTSTMFSYYFIMIALSGGVYNLIFGIMDSWALESGDYIYSKYSFIRAFGSIGWATGATLVAYIISLFGYEGLTITVLAFSILSFIVSLLIQDAQKANTATKQEVSVKDIKQLLTNPSYVVLIFILFLLFCINNVNVYAVVDKILYLNGTSADIGLKWLVHASIEVPTFFLGTYLLRKLNPFKLLSIGCISFAIQFFLFAYAKTIPFIIVLNLIQFFTYPMIHLASKVLLYKLSPDHLKSTGQLFAMSIFMGGSALVTPTVCGMITSATHINVTLIVAGVIGLVSFLLVIVLKRISNKQLV